MTAALGVPRRRRRRRAVVIAAVVVGALVLLALWIGIRGLLARDALTEAIPLARSAQTSLVAGDVSSAEKDVRALRSRAATAASLTSDPIWRAAEVVPGVGPNLAAIRRASGVVDRVAQDALPPLLRVASSVRPRDLLPTDGTVDTSRIVAARPDLSRAARVLDGAARDAEAIPTESTLPPVRKAVASLADRVREADETVGAASDAAEVLPAMLGSDGPRDYLLIVQNNAEVRATGGLPGAFAVLHADQGRVTLGAQASATDFHDRGPLVPVTASERVRWGENLTTYVQDVNLTPEFPRAASIATSMWENRFGQRLDGVLAVDPIALASVLRATGPVDVGSGIRLDSDNAVRVLLSESYSRFSTQSEQDAFFASTARTLFSKVLGGDADPAAVSTALSRAADERRILIWSADEAEEKVLARHPIAGDVVHADDATTALGVYYNDATGGKMDYYLDSSIAVGAAECRADGRPLLGVRVGLTSSAPADAAGSLPAYVTGGGASGTAAGSIRTKIYVYAPTGTDFADVRLDGHSIAYTADDDGRTSVAGADVTLTPGQSATVSWIALGPKNASATISLEHTPLIRRVPVDLTHRVTCPTRSGSGDTAAPRSVRPAV